MKRKIGFFGLMKPKESAKSSFEFMADGGIKATIHHDLMKNLTVKHLRWWFENIDGTTTFNGEDFSGLEINSYKLWHPHDHIKVRWKKKKLNSEGRIMPGSVISIKETFGGYLINEDAVISRFDNEEFNFDLKKLGIKVGELIHAYQEVDEGVKFKTEMIIKCEVFIIGKLLTWIAVKYIMHEKKIKAWMLHNIEESGESEKFIAKLYNRSQSK
tara:strand:- start:1291 stop:1932 length:642 start_codon:yes stop_codon:yes gene_type:complete